MSDKEQLDLLEKRIEILEQQILGDKTKRDSSEPPSTSITDLLLQTQLMISSALSCRDVVTVILKQVNIINEYLDPTHGETDCDIEDKRKYLLELHPQLQEDLQQLAMFEKLTTAVDSSNISKVTELYEKLDQLAVKNLNIHEESRDVTQKVLKSLQQYNDITNSIKLMFGQLDVALTNVELALTPKESIEE